MNKKRLLFLLTLPCLLASCEDTADLFDMTKTETGAYVEHVYNRYDAGTKEASGKIRSAITLQNQKSGYFCGSGVHNRASDCYGYGQAYEWHADKGWFTNSRGQDLIWGLGDGDDIIEGRAGVWQDNSPLFESVYSQNKRLDRFYEGFARGYLSRLYNGQIKCNGWSYYAMAVVSDEGFGTIFPYELHSAEYFATSLLVSTDYTPAPKYLGEDTGRVVCCDIDFTFLKYDASGELVGHKVTLDDVYLSCNGGAKYTSLVGFTFADAGISPSGIVGLSVNWRIENEVTTEKGKPTNHFADDGYHDGLSLYEILFPDSQWY